MSDPVLASFARFTASAARIDIPDTAMHAAKRCVLDYMGATLPGGAIAPASLMKVAFSDMPVSYTHLTLPTTPYV